MDQPDRPGEERPSATTSAAPRPEGEETAPRVRFSSAALEKVRELMEEEELTDGGLRISAHFGAGCSLPLNFDLELDVEPEEDEYVLEGGGIRIFIAPESSWAVDGLEVDYVESGAMGDGFAFRHRRGRARRAC